MAVDLNFPTADLYGYIRPLGYLLLLMGIWAVAVVVGPHLTVSNSPYSIADVVAGLADDRATWAGRTIRVRGRIAQLVIVTTGRAVDQATVQHENLPMSVLVCPKGSAGPSVSCKIVPAHGTIRVPSRRASVSRQVSLYVRLDSADLGVRPATLWVALRPTINILLPPCPGEDSTSTGLPSSPGERAHVSPLYAGMASWLVAA